MQKSKVIEPKQEEMPISKTVELTEEVKKLEKQVIEINAEIRDKETRRAETMNRLKAIKGTLPGLLVENKPEVKKMKEDYFELECLLQGLEMKLAELRAQSTSIPHIIQAKRREIARCTFYEELAPRYNSLIAETGKVLSEIFAIGPLSGVGFLGRLPQTLYAIDKNQQQIVVGWQKGR